MALSAYLDLIGQVSGRIRGEVGIAGREEQLEVIAFSFSVHAGVDPVSGMRTGDLSHLPFTITRAIDRASPGIVQLFHFGETIDVFQLHLWRPAPTGVEENYFTIELQNVHIVDYRVEMLNNKYPENMPHPAREHISFSYERLTQTSDLISGQFVNRPTG